MRGSTVCVRTLYFFEQTEHLLVLCATEHVQKIEEAILHYQGVHAIIQGCDLIKV